MLFDDLEQLVVLVSCPGLDRSSGYGIQRDECQGRHQREGALPDAGQQYSQQ